MSGRPSMHEEREDDGQSEGRSDDLHLYVCMHIDSDDLK